MYRNEAFTESLYADLSGVSLDSVFGMTELKKQLKQIAESVVSDELSRALGITPSRIILMKSGERNSTLYYARALCGELAKRSFSIIMLTPQIFLTGSYADFETKLTKALNEVIISSPCAVICSEVDMFCPGNDSASIEERLRAQLFTELLSELFTSGAKFIFIALTSDAGKVDREFLSMLDETVDIPAPDKEARKAYILDKLKCVNCTDDAAEYLAKQSEGDCFAKIDKLCEHAKLAVYKNMLAGANGDVGKAVQNAAERNAVLTLELVKTAE